MTNPDGMERAVEAAARAMWETWRIHDVAPDFYRDIDWDWMLERADDYPASMYVDAARKEARAALLAATPPTCRGSGAESRARRRMASAF